MDKIVGHAICPKIAAALKQIDWRKRTVDQLLGDAIRIAETDPAELHEMVARSIICGIDKLALFSLLVQAALCRTIAGHVSAQAIVVQDLSYRCLCNAAVSLVPVSSLAARI